MLEKGREGRRKGKPSGGEREGRRQGKGTGRREGGGRRRRRGGDGEGGREGEGGWENDNVLTDDLAREVGYVEDEERG